MFLELIATFAAAFAAAGMVLALNLITKGRLPRWAMPVAAGAAMLLVAVANEYSWGTRTIAGMPDGVEVVQEVQQSRWYKPWSYVAPQTVRLVAVDTESIQTNAELPGVKLVDMYLFARWQPPAQAPQLIRCAESSRADVTQATLADPTAAVWLPAEPDLIAAACKE